MQKLFKFYCDCGRLGEIEGLFIATQEQVDALVGKEVHFGEILGKYSDISVDIKEGMFEAMADEPDFVDKMRAIFKDDTIIGYNPLDFIDEEDEDDDDDDEEPIY